MKRDVPLQSRLASNMRRLRSERTWTQADVADRCGMVCQAVQRIEACRTGISLKTLARLADAFGVDAADLLAREGE